MKIFSKNNKTVPDIINKYKRREIIKWLTSILQGDPYFSTEKISAPHIYLLNIYTYLDPEIRSTTKDIVISFLIDLVKNPTSIWRSNSGEELLLFIQNIFIGYQHYSDPFEFLLFIVNKKWDFIFDGINLHWRSLQSLLYLEHHFDKEFWLSIHDKGGEEYGDLAFAGLLKTDFSFSINWLKEHTQEKKVVDAFFTKLPFLKEKAPSDLKRKLAEISNFIPENRFEEFLFLLKELNIELCSKVFDNFTQGELFELSKEFQLKLNEKLEKPEIHYEIENYLRKEFGDHGRYETNNIDVEIISSISTYLQQNPGYIKDEFRHVIVNSANELMKLYQVVFSEKDKKCLNKDISIIRMRGIDIVDKLEEIARKNDGL